MQTVIVPLTEKRNIAVYSVDDVEPYLERNKVLRGIGQKSDWGRHVASIPNIVMVQWLNEEWIRGNNIRYLSPEWDEIVAQKLRDPEYAYLRVDAPSHVVGYGS